MASSQFINYTSSDASGPGLIFGSAGDLLRVLDACLVNGYTGKAAAGWTKPIANASNIGCYRQGAGSGFTLLVNDNGSNVTSTFKEAWVTGWETIAGVGSPVGTGTGQFPTPAQLLTTGHGVWRKSTTADSTNGRYWTIWADSSTFYLWISTGDTVGMYYGGWFGDLFSLRGSTDAYRCMIIGRTSENSASASGDWDNITINMNQPVNAVTGPYVARGFGGGGTSVNIMKIGDSSALPGGLSGAAVGSIATPNGPDNSYYLSPLRAVESGTTVFVRGRYRGLYHVCHALANFSDGQTFQGSGDYAGKSFQIILKGPNSGMMAIETSATVETN